MKAAPWENWWWKNLICRLFHRRHKCYPGVHLPRPTYWHCQRCTDCGAEIDHLLERAAGTDQSQREEK